MIKFEQRPIEGIFLNRYKRFFADVDLNGQRVVAHVPNSGSLKGCAISGRWCLLITSDSPTRKLPYTLLAIESDPLKPQKTWVGVNTQIPNQLILKTLSEKVINDWNAFPFFYPEVKISDKSRVDFVLSTNSERPSQKSLIAEKFHFIEVKNVTMSDGETALFPDSVTERGKKHIDELVHLIKLGHTAEFCFVIQRTDITQFSPSYSIDPVYSEALHQAVSEGLRIRCLKVQIDANRVQIVSEEVPWKTAK